jgi:hypothetical protein
MLKLQTRVRGGVRGPAHSGFCQQEEFQLC